MDDLPHPEFSALEFWLEVETYRILFDQITSSTQLNHAAYIQQTFLVPHAPKRISTPLVNANQPEMEKVCAFLTLAVLAVACREFRLYFI
jgi:hypothetical protein